MDRPAEAVALRGEGLTLDQVAARLSVTRSTVWKYLHPEAWREHQRRWEARGHAGVRQKVARAVERGELSRPNYCEGCGSRGFVEAHHADYSRPLAVEWLCPDCHRSRRL